MKLKTILVAAAEVVGSVLYSPSLSQTAFAQSQVSPLAMFEGSLIDLSTGWGAATACTTNSTRTVCFRTEAEMRSYLANQPASLTSTCIPSVNLYSGTYFSGNVLNITDKSILVDLSSRGFDNVTSSYAIGYCSSRFFDGYSLTTAQYPGSTVAYASATTMAAGWDNRISSIIIQ